MKGEVLGLTRANGPVLLHCRCGCFSPKRKRAVANPLVAFTTNDVVTGDYVGIYERRNGSGNCRRQIIGSYYTYEDHFSSPISRVSLE